MNDQEHLAAKVEARDRALRAIRQADAFLVMTMIDERVFATVFGESEQQSAMVKALVAKLKYTMTVSFDITGDQTCVTT